MPISFQNVDWRNLGRAEMAKQRRRKRKAELVQQRLVPEDYITRDQLADLRDEIEDLLQSTQQTCEIVSRRCRSLERSFNDMKRTEERLALDFSAAQELFGLDKKAPSYRIRGEPVTWSYFHSWITRINQRLDELERMLRK